MYWDSAFCQPADAVKRAREITRKEKKYGSSHVWIRVFDTEDGVYYNQYYSVYCDSLEEARLIFEVVEDNFDRLIIKPTEKAEKYMVEVVE